MKWFARFAIRYGWLWRLLGDRVQKYILPVDYAFFALLEKYPDPKNREFCAVPRFEVDALAMAHGWRPSDLVDRYQPWMETT